MQTPKNKQKKPNFFFFSITFWYSFLFSDSERIFQGFYEVWHYQWILHLHRESMQQYILMHLANLILQGGCKHVTNFPFKLLSRISWSKLHSISTGFDQTLSVNISNHLVCWVDRPGNRHHCFAIKMFDVPRLSPFELFATGINRWFDRYFIIFFQLLRFDRIWFFVIYICGEKEG